MWNYRLLSKHTSSFTNPVLTCIQIQSTMFDCVIMIKIRKLNLKMIDEMHHDALPCTQFFDVLYCIKTNRFDSKIPFSRIIVLISPSRNRRRGWIKQFSAAVVNSRSDWPSFCSVCPTFISALPYAPSCPNSPPA